MQIMIMDLTSDILKIEDALEKTMNLDSDINYKIDKIKKLLDELNIAENRLSKFNLMLTPEQNK